MNILVGMTLFAIGFLAGGAVVVLITQAYQLCGQILAAGDAQRQTAAAAVEPASEPASEPPTEAAAEASVFVIPIMLDANRLVDVGFTQAYQEEAARIARWN